jgi:hypothetical protein
MAGIFENRTFLDWAFIVVLVLLVTCVCVLGWLIFNHYRNSRPTGDPEFDQYLGFAAILYILFFILPAVTATVVLSVLLVLLILLGHV